MDNLEDIAKNLGKLADLNKHIANASDSTRAWAASIEIARKKMEALRQETLASLGKDPEWSKLPVKSLKDVGLLIAKIKELKKEMSEGDGGVESQKNIERLRKEIELIRTVAPDAYKQAGDSARGFESLVGRSFQPAVEAVGTLGTQVSSLRNAYVDILGLTKEQADAAVSGAVGTQGSPYKRIGEMGEIEELIKAKESLASLGMDTSEIEERLSKKREVMSARALSDIKLTAAEYVNLKANADNASQGMNKMASLTGPIGKLAAKMAPEALMTHEAKKGAGPIGIKSVGLEAVSAALGGMAKALGPLSQALSYANVVGRLVMGMFEGLQEQSIVGAKQMQAAALGTNVAMGWTGARMLNSRQRIMEFAGAATWSGLAIRTAFDKEILPAAQKTLLTFNSFDRGEETIDSWAGALAGAAIDGQAMGKSYEESMGMVVKFSNAFGVAAERARSGFRAIMTGSRVAKLTTDQFMQSFGDLDEWGRRFGEVGDDVFIRLGQKIGASGIASTARKQMVLSGLSGTALDTSRMLGIGSALYGQKNAMHAVLQQYRMGGGGMTKLAGNMISDALHSRSFFGQGGMSIMQAMSQRKDDELAFAGARMAGFVAFKNADLGMAMLNEGFRKSVEQFYGQGDQKKLDELGIEAAKMTGNYTEAGMRAMVSSKDIMSQILEAVDRIGVIVGQYSSSMLGRAMGLSPMPYKRVGGDELSVKPMDFSAGG